MDNQNKQMINYIVHIVAIICIALCFFLNYVESDQVMGIQCFIDYSSKTYCTFGDSKQYGDCGDISLCKVTNATPYLASLIIVLAICAFIAKFMRQKIPFLGSQIAIYGVIGIEVVCAFLAFLTPTLLLSNMENNFHSRGFPVFSQYLAFILFGGVAVMDFMNKGETRTGGLLD